MFSKDTQPFDSIKCNLIQKLAYKVKYISQINGGLIMFFANSRIRFLKKVVGLFVNNMERVQEKGTQST